MSEQQKCHYLPYLASLTSQEINQARKILLGHSPQSFKLGLVQAGNPCQPPSVVRHLMISVT